MHVKLTQQKHDEYLTIIASVWADPIADLAYSWYKRINKRPDINWLTLSDRGACYSLILLLTVMLESYTLRAKTDLVEKSVNFNARDWWKRSNYSSKDDVLDLFVVRDVLAHNHLYSFANNSGTVDYIHIMGGDKLFQSRVKEGKLKHTGLSCIPDEIGPNHVMRMSEITKSALDYLYENYKSIGSVDFGFARRGTECNLWTVINNAASTAIKQRVIVDLTIT